MKLDSYIQLIVRDLDQNILLPSKNAQKHPPTMHAIPYSHKQTDHTAVGQQLR